MGDIEYRVLFLNLKIKENIEKHLYELSVSYFQSI